MQWQRAKTILIVVFFLINVFLASYLIFDPETSDGQSLADLTAVLSRNHIQLQLDTFPRNEESVFVPEWNSPVLTMKQIEEFVDAPVATKDGYTNASKTCSLTLVNNQLSYKNQAPNQKQFRSVTEKNVVSKLKNTLKTLGVAEWVYPTEIKRNGETITVTYGYQVEKRKLFGSHLQITVSPNGILEMEGFLGIPDRKSGFSYSLSQLETVLMSLAQTRETELVITDIEAGYYLNTYTDALVSQAIPVYEVRTSEGNLLLDARDGVENGERNLSSAGKGATS